MQQQMQVPTLSKFNKIFIMIYVGIFILSQILSNMGINLMGVLGLSLAGIKSGLIYQVLTFPLIETSFTSVLFNSLLIWFIGSDLELKWGARLYFKVMIIASVASAIGYLALCLIAGSTISFVPFYGLTGVVLTLLVAYGTIYSERVMLFMMLFPMKAKYFCMLLIGIELYMALFSSNSNAAWAHLVAMGSGFGYLKLRSLRAQGVSLSSLRREREKVKMKQRLKIVKDPEKPKADENNPKYWQ